MTLNECYTLVQSVKYIGEQVIYVTPHEWIAIMEMESPKPTFSTQVQQLGCIGNYLATPVVVDAGKAAEQRLRCLSK